MFDCIVRRAEEGGEVIFPVVYRNDHATTDHDKFKCLPCLRSALGPYIYGCQMLNDPVDESTLEFKRDWLRTFDWNDETANKLKASRAVLSIDPATRLKETNDYTGFCVTKTTEDNFIYVLEAKQMKVNSADLVKEVFRLVETYRPSVVLIETFAAQIFLKDILETEMRRRNVFFNLEETPNNTKESKAARIRGLIPHYAAGHVLHAKGLHDLEGQLVEFPRGAHDDVIDALAYQVPRWKAFKGQVPSESFKYGTFGWLKENHLNTNPDTSGQFKGLVRKSRRF
jgi:predicted phage terminase large subunit-like protein